jgi:hypothetical protein
MIKNSDLSFVFLRIIVFFITFTVFLYDTCADEAAYKKAIDYIENLNDRLPNDEDYFQVCSFSDTCFLSPSERLKIWKKIISLQKSTISRADLLSIFRAKRNSLNDVKITYSEKTLNCRNIAQQIEHQYAYTFAFAPDRLFLDRNGDDFEHVITSYDGKVVRTVTEHNSDLPNADVMNTSSLRLRIVHPLINMPFFAARFYHLNMPLFPAMLFNPARCDASWQFNFDLESFLEAEKTHVLDRDIQLNGKKCIVVLDLSTKIYLDPEKDFSVIRFEKYAHNAVPTQLQSTPIPLSSLLGQDVRITGRKLIYRSDLTDLKNYGNGIWIPSKIENTIFNTTFNEQNVVEQSVVTIEDVRVNEGIPQTFFTEIVLVGAGLF